MERLVESWVKLVGFWIVLLLLPFVVNAAPNGTFIFTHPIHNRGIWLGGVKGQNARQLFNPPLFITRISVQEGNRYILVVGEGLGNKEVGVDAYLFDRQNRLAGRKDLTLGWFGEIIDAAISRNGDVVFINTINQEHPDGLYILPNHEVWQPIPKAEKLFHGPAASVACSPDGEEIAFSNNEGIFLLNIFTKEISLLLKDAYQPAFSPDGKHLAFLLRVPTQNPQAPSREIGIIALREPDKVDVLNVEKTYIYTYLTWSADGKYLTVTANLPGALDIVNLAIPVSGGRPEPIFQEFENGVWRFEWENKPYPVEPINSLATTWGKLKAQKSKEGIHE